ncbi:hypothetical protein FFLO_05284 [Filobasidium floriforme]|uniref:Uncharacterized protein n=1 Tax=Filobasidium floriforme TaxID=5210 RepID=A0A8K0NP01_9TREE|nr:hypothetical protein FFLO_05284 [Filobasidium floriforme]
MSSSSLLTMAQQLESLKYQPEPEEYDHSVLRLLNERYSTWEDLVRLSENAGAGPSGLRYGEEEGEGKFTQEDGWDLDVDEDELEDGAAIDEKKEQDLRGEMTLLEAEIEKWKDLERNSTESLAKVNAEIAPLHAKTQAQLQQLLAQTSQLSDSRYALMDDLGRLTGELVSSNANGDMTGELGGNGEEDTLTLLERMEKARTRLDALGLGIKWMGVLERVMLSAQETLEARQLGKTSPTPLRSPLPSIAPFKNLHNLLISLSTTLPPDFHLLAIAQRVHRQVWREMKGWGQKALEGALDGIGWPGRGVAYESVGVEERRRFERSFKELLVLQQEGIKLFDSTPEKLKSVLNFDAEIEIGLYPIVAMVRSVKQRFVFHFEGDRGTNRLDKPEWAFSSVLDTIYEQRAFAETYLQALVSRTGTMFKDVDAVSELTAQLLTLPLALLKHRFPHLFPHPPLLAHTVYQTVVFDDSIKRGGFSSTRAWKATRRRQLRGSDGGTDEDEWEGLTEEILNTDDWFERWWQSEKEFASEQYEEITSSPEAWTLVDVSEGGDTESESALERRRDFKPTIGARQVRALVEQVADRYASLPTLRHKYPFLAQVQLPILDSYRKRIASSLDAFETLASTFARAVPGALAGHSRENGLGMDTAKMTSGVGGLQRLTKAWISAKWLMDAMERWGDEMLYLELVTEISNSPDYIARARHDGIAVDDGANPYDIAVEQYRTLVNRAESMIVKHVTAEVERDLRTHLTRRWDANASSMDKEGTTMALIGPLTTLSAHLGHLARMLPASAAGHLYRAIVAHVTNHIMQRAVYAGWSKFTEYGGQELVAETNAWVEASTLGLRECDAIRRPGLPWQAFGETARLLSLPTEAKEEQPVTFAQAVAMAFDSQYARLTELLDIKELDQGQAQVVLKRRIDCWR